MKRITPPFPLPSPRARIIQWNTLPDELNAWAVTIGFWRWCIIFVSDQTVNDPDLFHRVITHESEHVRQWTRHPFLFVPIVLFQDAWYGKVDGRWAGPWEKAARYAAGEPV